MKLLYLTIFGSLFLNQFFGSVNASNNIVANEIDDDIDYSDPNAVIDGPWSRRNRKKLRKIARKHNRDINFPETTAINNIFTTDDNSGIKMENANDYDIDNDSNGSHRNDSNVPLPIIIVFVFMFTMLGVICIQQLQRMFAENKEYDNIKFDIRENRATSRSGKTYGTVTMRNVNNGNINHNKNNNNNKQNTNGNNNKIDNNNNNNDNSFQHSRVVTVYSETDEKVDEMSIATKVRKKFSLSKYKVVGEARETSSSDECVELGSGYDTATMNNNNNNRNNNNTVAISSNNNETRDKKTSKKIQEQVRVATKGLKDKIDKIEQKLHGSKLNSRKNRYKGYGSLKQSNNSNGNDDNDDTDDNNDNDNDSNISEDDCNNKKNLNESDISNDVKHPGYGMNYGYSEDYDCDFEDSDTQLSDEGDDIAKPNETVIRSVVLE